MSDLSNALQGKLNSSRKSHIKDPSERQLDLFSSLTDRSSAGPKIVAPPVEPRSGPRPEPEMILPPSSGNPPDVAADVRAVLSESDQFRADEAAPQGGGEHRPLPRTGIYHRPQRPAAPAPAPSQPAAPRSAAPSAPRKPAASRSALAQRIRGWFAGVELDRRVVSLVVLLVVLVALVAFWTALPESGEVGTAVDLAETQEAGPPEPTAQEPAAAAGAPATAPVPAPAPAATPAPAPALAADWKIPGTTTVLNGGAYLVRFNDPVFVSADKISVEGMRALKAVGAKLAALKGGAKVVVTGYTDDEPLTKPTDQFRDNADIAAARAKVAVEHLALFARANKGLVFEAQTGLPAQAPYPNDSPQNRRLNRTATVQVIPAP